VTPLTQYKRGLGDYTQSFKGNGLTRHSQRKTRIESGYLTCSLRDKTVKFSQKR
jgi:hypothetical protein